MKNVRPRNARVTAMGVFAFFVALSLLAAMFTLTSCEGIEVGGA